MKDHFDCSESTAFSVDQYLETVYKVLSNLKIL